MVASTNITGHGIPTLDLQAQISLVDLGAESIPTPITGLHCGS
jgi:hypothetical protein